MQTIDSPIIPDNFQNSVLQYRADLDTFIAKMTREGLDGQAIEAFSRHYLRMRSGEQGFISEKDITPIQLNDIADYSATESLQSYGEELLSRTVVIKLNGGLGTTLGCEGPKSLIEIRPGLDFLAIAVECTRKFATAAGRSPALLLMNSFHTEPLMHDALRRYHDRSDIQPKTFLQHKFPKVLVSTLLPAEYPQHPHLEWNPPGHGDLFSALDTSGTLQTLLDRNYRYAFISNIDNVGAGLDTGILGFLAKNNIEFLMEVTDRTKTDRKGGHLARNRDGQLILREAAQCPPEDMTYFGDIERHRFFNTNNLWIDLFALRELLNRNNGILNLPLICNKKNLDPLDPATPSVFQLESAMGAALSQFQAAWILRVPRTRFIPVKNSEDLLLLQSDLFTIKNDFSIQPTNDAQQGFPEIKFDRAYYTTVEQLAAHFPYGVPSLRECTSLKVEGDVVFGKNILIYGAVTITNRSGRVVRLPDNSRIDCDLVLP